MSKQNKNVLHIALIACVDASIALVQGQSNVEDAVNALVRYALSSSDDVLEAGKSLIASVAKPDPQLVHQIVAEYLKSSDDAKPVRDHIAKILASPNLSTYETALNELASRDEIDAKLLTAIGAAIQGFDYRELQDVGVVDLSDKGVMTLRLPSMPDNAGYDASQIVSRCVSRFDSALVGNVESTITKSEGEKNSESIKVVVSLKNGRSAEWNATIGEVVVKMGEVEHTEVQMSQSVKVK